MLGICYWPPNQDDRADNTSLSLLSVKVFVQQNLVLMGDFNYLGIFLENSTAAAHQVPEMQWALLPDTDAENAD